MNTLKTNLICILLIQICALNINAQSTLFIPEFHIVSSKHEPIISIDEEERNGTKGSEWYYSLNANRISGQLGFQFGLSYGQERYDFSMGDSTNNFVFHKIGFPLSALYYLDSDPYKTVRYLIDAGIHPQIIINQKNKTEAINISDEFVNKFSINPSVGFGVEIAFVRIKLAYQARFQPLLQSEDKLQHQVRLGIGILIGDL